MSMTAQARQASNARANIATGKGLGKGDLEVGPYAEAQLVARSNEDLAEIRANSALPVDSWEAMDDAVFRAETDVLRIIADLRAAGLTTDASIYDEEITWQPVDASHDATISMSPETETDEGAAEYGKQGAPLPIVHSDYSIGFRERGPRGISNEGALDTLNAWGASWAVNRSFEEMVVYGWPPSVGGDGYTLWGLANHPNTSTGTLGDWTTDNTLIRSDVRSMMSQIKNDNNHRPGNAGYWLYLASDLEDELDDVDPAGSGDLLVRDRVENLSGLARISTTDVLEPGSALMFRPTADVIDLAMAEDLQTVQWDDPFRDNYKVILAGTPRVKATLQGQSGIAYWTQA